MYVVPPQFVVGCKRAEKMRSSSFQIQAIPAAGKFGDNKIRIKKSLAVEKSRRRQRLVFQSCLCILSVASNSLTNKLIPVKVYIRVFCMWQQHHNDHKMHHPPPLVVIHRDSLCVSCAFALQLLSSQIIFNHFLRSERSL